ncbi:MAG: prepilin-type N-terminal cleavage/methylation domain-containing protein [bacterium]|nr:prepilin-type N-terminal cleavage/methylation domain-containing protein [bacterium]
MASRKISTHNGGLPAQAGFTLMEMLIVMGIILVIASAPLFIDLTSYRADAFRAERSAVVTLLQKARADALNNINQQAHGVAFFPPDHQKSYVVFEGDSYAASDPATREVSDGNYLVTFGAGSPSEVAFTQLDGSANFSGDIVLVDTQRAATTTITINHEGAISY